MISLLLFRRASLRNLSSFPIRIVPFRCLCGNNGHNDDDKGNDDEPEKRSEFCSVLPETLLFGDAAAASSAAAPSDGAGNVEDDEFGGDDDEENSTRFDDFIPRRRFLEHVRAEADRVYEVLQRDGPGIDFRSMLEEMRLKVSNALVREVLLRIRKSINGANKERCARLAYKFFIWSGEQKGYQHTVHAYNLAIKIYADCGEFKAMWMLVNEMTKNGLPVTPRTFNVLICTCGEAGMRRKVVVRFIRSQSFNFRPFRHSYNAILHSFVTLKQYRLIEWVYKLMLDDGHFPDVLTYNVLMCAKFRLGKMDEFHKLLDEMGQNEIVPDLHTYNLLLHVLGKGDKPLAALNLLNYMEDVHCPPRVIHFTTLIDGLSRAGNTDACKYFFDMMVKKGCEPDVVCYTALITGYTLSGEFEKARNLFEEMITKGKLPNVFTYNSMIRGLCLVGEFDEACSMLMDMEKKGCTPNFSVYSMLVGRLRRAGKDSTAKRIIQQMVDKGRYTHLIGRFMVYRRL